MEPKYHIMGYIWGEEAKKALWGFYGSAGTPACKDGVFEVRTRSGLVLTIPHPDPFKHIFNLKYDQESIAQAAQFLEGLILAVPVAHRPDSTWLAPELKGLIAQMWPDCTPYGEVTWDVQPTLHISLTFDRFTRSDLSLDEVAI